MGEGGRGRTHKRVLVNLGLLFVTPLSRSRPAPLNPCMTSYFLFPPPPPPPPHSGVPQSARLVGPGMASAAAAAAAVRGGCFRRLLPTTLPSPPFPLPLEGLAVFQIWCCVEYKYTNYETSLLYI